jgi:hypothetical protein
MNLKSLARKKQNDKIYIKEVFYDKKRNKKLKNKENVSTVNYVLL